METKDLKHLCYEYISVIIELCKGSEDTYRLDKTRTEIHDKIIELLNDDHAKFQIISSSLDVWIGFPGTIKDQSTQVYSKRLFDIISSIFYQRADFSQIKEMHKKLQMLYFDDFEFKGWVPSIKI